MLVHSHSQSQGSDGSCISVIVVAMKYLGSKLGYWGDSYINYNLTARLYLLVLVT